MREILPYRTRSVKVEAVQWEPDMGVGHGVERRPKKHPANPDEWFVRDRFGKETLIYGGEVIVTYPDGSHEALSAGKFEALYEPEEPEPVANPPPTGHQEAPAGATATISPETSTGASGESDASTGQLGGKSEIDEAPI